MTLDIAKYCRLTLVSGVWMILIQKVLIEPWEPREAWDFVG